MKLKTKIKHLKHKLGRKALRNPKSKRQKATRLLYERVDKIWKNRYEWKNKIDS